MLRDHSWQCLDDCAMLEIELVLQHTKHGLQFVELSVAPSFFSCSKLYFHLGIGIITLSFPKLTFIFV